jgi:glycosyltransferase involved in cell wall biosynthesis
MSIKLSITIPTYNRNEVLKENLEYLLPQLNANCELIILDNCSDIPVSETLSPLLANYENLNIRVIRNKLNIGICANILRCFEVCNGEWVWILGDFHPVFSNSVEIITRDLDLKEDFFV